MSEDLLLHGYWRSGAAYRVRIALNLKAIAFGQATHDLRAGAQRAAGFLALAPQGLVPALETPDGVLTQSLSIIEWLEETHPYPPLLPSEPFARAEVRAMTALIACDIHPLNNLRVLNALRSNLGATPEQVGAWIGQWIGEGFSALEGLVERHSGAFAFGDRPGLVDCFLTPQVASATRYRVDLEPYPAIRRVTAEAAKLPAFEKARPEAQPDADAPED